MLRQRSRSRAWGSSCGASKRRGCRRTRPVTPPAVCDALRGLADLLRGLEQGGRSSGGGGSSSDSDALLRPFSPLYNAGLHQALEVGGFHCLTPVIHGEYIPAGGRTGLRSQARALHAAAGTACDSGKCCSATTELKGRAGGGVQPVAGGAAVPIVTCCAGSGGSMCSAGPPAQAGAAHLQGCSPICDGREAAEAPQSSACRPAV